jgi:hemolysin activation/secretion protein
MLAGCGSAFAQAPPDAGRIQQEIERSRIPAPAPRAPAAPLVEEPVRPALAAPASARFLVKGFRITRATAFPEAELAALLAQFTGRELSLADLQRAADVLTRHYRDRGYFVARAYVPAQEIRDGIVEITVLEGRIDRISVRPTSDTRLAEGLVESTLRGALGADGLIREAELERGLLLLNDLPGVEARATLAPGRSLGVSDVTVELNEGPLVTGNVDFDTYGNKFSGT